MYVSTWLDHGISRCLAKHFFLGVPMRVSIEEINILFGRRREPNSPPQCGRASSHSWRYWIEQKGKEMLNSFSAWLLAWNTNLIPILSHSQFSRFQIQTIIYINRFLALRSSIFMTGFPRSPLCTFCGFLDSITL